MRPSSNIKFVATPFAQDLKRDTLLSIMSMIDKDDTPHVLKSNCRSILASIAQDQQGSKDAAEETLRYIKSGEIDIWAHDHVLAGFLVSGNFHHASRAICMVAGLDAWVEFYTVESNKKLPSTVIEIGFDCSNIVIVYIQKSIFDRPDVFSDMRRIVQILPLLSNYSHLRSPRDKYVLLDLSDFGFDSALSFSGTKIGNLIPDSFFLNDRGYAGLRSHYSMNWTEWKKRKDVVFWRGSSTGMSQFWRDLPRVKLCQWGRDKNDDKFDIKLVEIVQRSEVDAMEISEENIIGAHIPATKFTEYKYHIDIDGNTNSWPGLFIKLLSGSPVIKIDSAEGYRQWYYDKLIPWHNYVPVLSDLSDIDNALELLTQDQVLAENIGANGRKLASQLSFCDELDRASSTIGRMASPFSSLAE